MEVALSRVGRQIVYSSDDDLLVDINARKEGHQILATMFHRGRSAIPYQIHLAKYGEPARTSYDKEFSIDHAGISKTLLSLLITERFLLAKKKLLKHTTIAIVGLAGSGKTTYSVASIIGSLRLLGLDWTGLIGKLVYFEPIGFVDFVKSNLEERVWVPAVLVDDVGAQISKYWIWLGQRWWAQLFSVLDHLKDWCGVLIMTASSYKVIPSGLRDKIDIVVEATEATYKGHVINIFLYYRRDKYSDRSSRVPIYIDVFPPTFRMPKQVWDSMMESRRDIGIARLREIKKILEERAKQHGEDVEEELVEGEFNELSED